MSRFTQVLLVAMVLVALCLPEVEAQRRRRRSRGRPAQGGLNVHPKAPNLGLPFRVTQVVYLNISVDEKELGQIRIALFGETVPRTVENFRALVTGEKGFGYAGSKFHRLVRGFLLQGGDFQNADGTGGYSVYKGGRFEDENFIIPNAIRTVSMANAGPNSNGAQFFVNLNNNRFLNGKHVVFGIVIANYRGLVKQIERKVKVNRTTDEIQSEVRITKAGIVDDYEVFTAALVGAHAAREDGKEGPRVPKPKPGSRRRRSRRGGRRTRRGGRRTRRGGRRTRRGGRRTRRGYY